jgi:hypothetical protein
VKPASKIPAAHHSSVHHFLPVFTCAQLLTSG